MSDAYTISAVIPYLLAQVAGTVGVDADRVLRAAGMVPGAPLAPDDHVSAEAYFAAWRLVMERVGDPAFPLRVAAASQLEDSEIFGFLAMSCATLGEAYDRTASFRALYNRGARWELQREPDVARLIWYPWPGPFDDVGYRGAMDFQVADMANAVQRLGRAHPRPLAVCLRHAPVADIAPFVTQYGVAPTFGAPLDELVYAADLPDQPVGTFNSHLRDYFDAECRRLLAKTSADSSLVEQIRKHLILAMDGGDTSIETMAKRLAMSVRTLQRRLAEEGVRYNEVLDDIREEFAKRYLARGTVSASEVAHLVGFTEPPAFFKAFKRWTGMTPGAFQTVR